MGTRLTPAPVSLPPETGEIDESWEDLVLAGYGKVRPSEEPDPAVFDRPTAVPVPGSALELDFGSFPPRQAAPKELLSPFESAPPELGARADDPMEVSLEPESHSPLDLVETYRRSIANMPAVRPADTEHSGDQGRDAGNVQDMQDRYAVGDFTGALIVAESLLDAHPENEDAKRYAQSCREVLTQMYAARIGPMDQVATVAVPPDQITWLSLDHRAGFLLSLVDGVSSIEEILDISGMTRLDALRIMYTLVQQNVIALTHR